ACLPGQVLGCPRTQDRWRVVGVTILKNRDARPLQENEGPARASGNSSPNRTLLYKSSCL
ncbi:hypothetical protein BGZ75_001195, partial [Mortierella antarctica]